MKRISFLFAFLFVCGCSNNKAVTAQNATQNTAPSTPSTPKPMVAAELRSPYITARVNVAELTEAEKQVKQQIAQDGIHVIHFWSPWCGNSKNELRNGWYELIEQYKDVPDVHFTFVTIWNDLKSGRETMKQYAIPESVPELLFGEEGDSDSRLRRQKVFLRLPLTWTPTTWVFHKNGQLASAFNYGEVQMSQLKAAIDGAKSDWHHE